ncbi:MAG: hypothetical protein RL681_874 [Candidatus Parcubacteria bacterium]|jgi:hypothetical protein
MYLIQGVFFQKLTGLDLDYSEGDARAVIRTSACYFMYVGAFGPDPDRGGNWHGRMNDHFGESEITNISFSERHLHFTKEYDGRSDVIHYAFAKEANGLWLGAFDGPGDMCGESKCVIAQVPDDFLRPTRTPQPPAVQ